MKQSKFDSRGQEAKRQWNRKYIMMLSNQLTPYNGGVQYYLRDRDYCQLDDPIERKAWGSLLLHSQIVMEA